MYQEHFGFNRRPFAAVPDIGLFVENAANRACLDAAMVCLQSGQGIAILTAPTGVGKTSWCHKLADSLKSPFVTVLLPNSNFATQRALLQSVLFELGRKYVRLEEQELRLELVSALRTYDNRDEKVVLIIDEAEHLKPEILEEIRNLANLSESGRPLVRVVLSGQPQLEERLLEPDMTALNQRIRSQLYLQPLTRIESMNYIADQIQLCGRVAELVIQEDALELMVHAADGNCRCLNQLADHSLLLAYMSGERPVSLKTVREALDDLKQLPLQWNDPGTMAADTDELITDHDPVSQTADSGDIQSEATARDTETHFDAAIDSPDGGASFEVGGGDSAAWTTSEAVSDEPGFDEADFDEAVSDEPGFDEVGDTEEAADSSESWGESVSVDDELTCDQTDHDIAVFEVGAGDDCHERVSSIMHDHEATDTDDDGVIELPTDPDSYAAYEQCDPVTHEVIEAQEIAAAFLDSDEFSDSYQLDSPSLTGDDAVLEIPRVPLELSTFESFDPTPDEGPTLSLVDRLDDEPAGDSDADPQHQTIEDLESFAEQAVGSANAEVEHSHENAAVDEPYEELVFDRYAWLDAGGNPAEVVDQSQLATRPADTTDCGETRIVGDEAGSTCNDEELADEMIDHEMLQSADESGTAADSPAELADPEPDEPTDVIEQFDVIMADPPMDELEPSIAVEVDEVDLAADLLDEEREMLGLCVDDEIYDVVHPPDYDPSDSTTEYSDDIVTTVAMPSATDATVGETEPTEDRQVAVISPAESDEEPDGDRTYANLFSRLRQLQLAAREMDDRI